jgi:UDP-N-acetylmuramoyl-tripeptide--D-alanyl-D-alanine ligase
LPSHCLSIRFRYKEFKVIYEESRESLLEHLGDLVQEGDTILVKASHFMQFEEVVKALEEM